MLPIYFNCYPPRSQAPAWERISGSSASESGVGRVRRPSFSGVPRLQWQASIWTSDPLRHMLLSKWSRGAYFSRNSTPSANCIGGRRGSRGEKKLDSRFLLAFRQFLAWREGGCIRAYAACVCKSRRRRAIYSLKLFFCLFRPGVSSGVDCCENKTLPPRRGTPLTSSMINWHKRVSRGRTFNSKGPWLTISRVILPLNPA
jgi:hypothetical protein